MPEVHLTEWPNEQERERLQSEMTDRRTALFFCVRTYVDFAASFESGVIVSSETLPMACVKIVIPRDVERDFFLTEHKYARRFHGYVNALTRTDISWSAIGISSGMSWIDRYKADPEKTGTLVHRLLPQVPAPRDKDGFRKIDERSYEELCRRILELYLRGLSLAAFVQEGTPLDRALLSYGHSFTQTYADDQFAPLWRTLDSASHHLIPSRQRPRGVLARVVEAVSRVTGKWPKDKIAGWYSLRNEIVHEGTSDQVFLKCAHEIVDVHDCATEVVDVLLAGLP